MILKDIIKDYQYIHEILEPCQDYFITSEHLINNYCSMVSETTSTYFLSSHLDSDKNIYINSLKEAYDESYQTIVKLVSLSYFLYGAMAKLDDYKTDNTALLLEIENFLSCGSTTISAINKIISRESIGMRLDGLLSGLIPSLQALMRAYHILLSYAGQLETIDQMLMENIPKNVSDANTYNCIELHSQKPLLNLSSFSDDIANLSSFISQFESIMNQERGAGKIYTQRIESGSLRIVWGSNTIELTSISDIIKALSEGIRKFRLTSAEKKLKNEKARELKLQNDEHELAIINTQINAIAQLTGLSKDNPDDVEKLQKLCLPLVRYINNNPVGMVGDYKYNLSNDLKLIEDFYQDTQ